MDKKELERRIDFLTRMLSCQGPTSLMTDTIERLRHNLLIDLAECSKGATE